MKACTAQKEKEAVKYMQKFTTNPLAPKSARTHRRGSAGTAVFNLNAVSQKGLGLNLPARPESAGAKYPELPHNNSVGRQKQNIHHQESSTKDTNKPQKDGPVPRPPNLPVSTPLQSQQVPLGAHAAGFYSKQHLNNTRLAIHSSNVPDILKEAGMNNTSGVNLSINGSVPGSANPRHKRSHTVDGVMSEEVTNGDIKEIVENSDQVTSSIFRRPNLRKGGIGVVITGGTGVAVELEAGTGTISEATGGGAGGPGAAKHAKGGNARRGTIQMMDVGSMDTELLVLIDTECQAEQILDALNNLIPVAEEQTPMLYDRGTVSILLALITRMNDNKEVVYKATYILELLANSYPPALASIYKQNGIMTFMGTLQNWYKAEAAKTAAEVALSTFEPMTRGAGSKRNKKLSANTGSRSNSRSNLARATSLGSANSLHSLSNDDNAGLITSGLSQKLHSMPAGSFKTADTANTNANVNNADENIVQGLLQKYFDPRFLQQMEKMDKTTRAEIIKHLLTLFEKVDRLLTVNSLISLDVDLDEALDLIVAEAENMLQCELILMYLIDSDTGDLIAVDYQPWMDAKERELAKEVRFPLGTGIAGWVAKTGECLNIKDPMNNDRFDDEVDLRGADINPHSILCVPVRNKHGVIKGVIEAVNKVSPTGAQMLFNHEDEYLLKTLGKQSGIIITNAQIYDQMKKTQKKVEVLLDTTRSLGSVLELDRLIEMIMDAAKELLDADRCTLFLVDSKGKQLRAHIQGRDKMQEIRIPITAGIAGFVFMSGESVNIPDAYSDSRFNPEVDRQTGYVTRNILCMPIKNISGESIGVTQMINRRQRAFDIDDEKILGSFSAQAAVAIEKSYLFKKTEDMLRETSQVKNYLFMILQSITNVVITLDSQGRLSHINHPAKLEIEPLLDAMKSSSYEIWLGQENATLVADIQRAYQTPGGTIIAQDYELSLQGKLRNVNYTIVQMTSDIVNSKDDNNPDAAATNGVVIVFEDISSEKRALMTLGRYMSPALAKQVMAEDGGQLGGKRKKVAILFSDIRSFTTLSESMEPHEVVELLNHHFSDAVNAILSEQGILDKYIGDAVMAVFGVPFVSAEDSIHACNAALRMKESLAIFNEHRLKNGMKQIKIGVGINTGMVLSGNIGSTKRMEFSCIGDAVNLASRIEGLTKHYHTVILITENTLYETGDAFITREVDQVVVTGKSTKVGIYELLGRKGEILPDDVASGVDMYKEALSKYRKQQFVEAAEIFEAAIDIADDGPSKTMLARCKAYMEKPPPKDWTGTYYSDSK
ncbi:hypothetical protein HDU76_010904 [Blyttiomyces sp. JEL0837]|nr:hypothetical protein HDU76_010904 [Blyttiomyces sp. JEL0837]